MAAAMQQLQDANHAVVETSGLTNVVVASPNTTPIAARYPTRRHYLPSKDQPLEPFPSFETKPEINLQSGSYRHEDPNVSANSQRFVRNVSASPHIEVYKKMSSLNDSTYGSPTVATRSQDRVPTIYCAR